MIRLIVATDRSRSLEVRPSDREGSVVHLTVRGVARDDALTPVLLDLSLDDDGARELISALASARFEGRYAGRFS